MAKKEIHVELLLGKRVFALNGRSIGRLEEIRAELNKGECFVAEFLVGSYALLERLSALSIGRDVLRLLGARSKHGGYRIPWNKLDLSDPEQPRLLCKVSELLPLNVA
jgi:sporulation protein YlmC with PRC-barrel domain